MLRRITVIGNLTKDAEVKEVQGRFAINFSVAVNEYFKDAKGDKLEKSTYYNCVVWRNENVKVADYLTKGTKVMLEGLPEPEMYKSKDGEMKCAIKILVSNLILLGGGSGHKTEGEGSEGKKPNENSNTGKKDDLPF